jgi:hypothetical protein
MSRNPSPSRPKANRARPVGGQPAQRGPHIGPLRITPLRVTLGIALAGGLVFLAWSVLVRDANQAYQVPMMATGFAVCGIVLAIVAFLSLGKVVSAGREGRDGIAVLTALAGGVAAAAAMPLLAGAVIMSLIWSGTKSS